MLGDSLLGWITIGHYYIDKEYIYIGPTEVQ